MADGTPRTPIVAEEAGDRLYIIDARNGVERKLLLDWIHATAGDAERNWDGEPSRFSTPYMHGVHV
jgi:glycerol-3-phosphate O-acyltransferase